MKLSGNTILITGGGSGIGRGLAEALHQRENHVIIAGRRTDRLREVAKANPGMAWVELNIEDPASISAVATKLTAEYPKLNVLVNNAGIMNIDDVSSAIDEKLLVSTLTTNLMGPIRMTGALIEHLKRQTEATVINTTSVLGFVPLAITAVYSSTKAAMHSYTMSPSVQAQRHACQGARVSARRGCRPTCLAATTNPGQCHLPSLSRRRCEFSEPMPTRCWWRGPSSCGTTLDPTRPRSLLSSMMRSEQNNEVNMETNKEVVLKVLKGAFIERDATVVDRYFSPDYIQHNPVIPNGPRAIANLIPTLKGLSYEIGMVVAEGDLVMVHGRYVGWGPKPLVAVDIFKVKNGKSR